MDQSFCAPRSSDLIKSTETLLFEHTFNWLLAAIVSCYSGWSQIIPVSKEGQATYSLLAAKKFGIFEFRAKIQI
jgi:hypothetical protein